MASDVLLFAGPTLDGKSRELIKESGIQLRPPIQRNDLTLLSEDEFAGTIIIVDGFFKQVMAVGHAEIRTIIEQGCTVFGLSSMGAIRAFEMHNLGMKGFGRTYQWFFNMEDFQDDEVALLHSDAPQYLPFSEPLVHFRECVKDLTKRKRLKMSAGKNIIKKMKSCYYGDRTMRLFLELLDKYGKLKVEDDLDFGPYRIKQLDLIEFLERKTWKSV